MKSVTKLLGAVILSIGGTIFVYSQQCPNNPNITMRKDPLPLSECRTIGNGRGTFHTKDDYIGAGITIYLAGKQTDVVNGPAASIRLLNDILIMRFGYSAPKKIIPTEVFFELRSLSTQDAKYGDNAKLTFYLDGELFLSKNIERYEQSWMREIFNLELQYKDFLRITAAKKITIQLGDTKIELKQEDVEALNELNKTTKDLVLPKHPNVYM